MAFKISDNELEDLLHRYTRDITAQDSEGKFDPISGRDAELDMMVLILLQRLRKNVILLGGAGVGKTACFIGLAQLINQNKVPRMLAGGRVIELEMSMIGAGSSSRADLEGRFIPIVRGVAERNARRDRPPVIFCIDEIHQLMVTFKHSSAAGIADLMKPYLTAGDLYILGATTREEYDDYVKTDPAIDRRFQKIFLSAPDVQQTAGILQRMKGNFETHYSLTIEDATIARLVKLTDRFIRQRNQPDKSILVLDQACAYAVKGGKTDRLDDLSVNKAVAAEAGIDPAALA